MRYIVYKITNKFNDKTYIGAHGTMDINDKYMGSSKLLNKAIRIYGIDSFIKEIIYEAITKEEMYNKEKELVQIGRFSYNLKEGGIGGCGNHNELTKQKISMARKGVFCGVKAPNYGRVWSEEVRRKISESLKSKSHASGGIICSKETKEKISLSLKGKRSGCNNPRYGCVVSEETKEKIRNKNKGKKPVITDITIYKMSLAKRGTCHITKDGIDKMIKRDKLDDYLSSGWIKGRPLRTK